MTTFEKTIFTGSYEEIKNHFVNNLNTDFAVNWDVFSAYLEHINKEYHSETYHVLFVRIDNRDTYAILPVNYVALNDFLYDDDGIVKAVEFKRRAATNFLTYPSVIQSAFNRIVNYITHNPEHRQDIAQALITEIERLIIQEKKLLNK